MEGKALKFLISWDNGAGFVNKITKIYVVVVYVKQARAQVSTHRLTKQLQNIDKYNLGFLQVGL